MPFWDPGDDLRPTMASKNFQHLEGSRVQGFGIQRPVRAIRVGTLSFQIVALTAVDSFGAQA